MSGSGGGGGNDPFDPFGSNDRTIIRPNPGGRRPQNAGGGAGISYPQPGSGQPPQQPPQQPPHQPQGAPQGVPGSQPQGGWGQAPDPNQLPQGQQQPQYAPQPMPNETMPAMISMPGSNPFISAAGPLMNLLGRLRNGAVGVSLVQLKESVARAIDAFENEARVRGAVADQIPYAKYALCATADDIVQNLPSEERYIWTQDSMLSRYFGERTGGVRFFDNLDALIRSPAAHYDLIELHYHCLSLGFEGMHRTSAAGQGALQTIRRDTYKALRGARAGIGWDLSPRWKGRDLARRSVGMQIPFWAVAALSIALIAGLFFTLRALLVGDADALARDLSILHPQTQLSLVRESYTPDAPPPPPPPPPPPADAGQLERLQAALANEIATRGVVVDYLDQNYIIVRLPNEVLFDTGSADVNASFSDDLGKRIGEVFHREVEMLAQRGFRHGQVIAVGHSDAQPIGTGSRWASNWELSQARAKSVADAVTPWVQPGFEIQIEGRGPDDPLCRPAEDPGCWPRNRRVELLIERTR